MLRDIIKKSLENAAGAPCRPDDIYLIAALLFVEMYIATIGYRLIRPDVNHKNRQITDVTPFEFTVPSFYQTFNLSLYTSVAGRYGVFSISGLLKIVCQVSRYVWKWHRFLRMRFTDGQCICRSIQNSFFMPEGPESVTFIV